MFTGIVTKVAPVRHVDHNGDEAVLRIATSFTDLVRGESIAVNGACLTVAESTEAGDAVFYASPETLRCTNLGTLRAMTLVNLERALKVGDRLSGHWVQGHVDGLGELVRLDADAGAYALEVRVPENLRKYCVNKGSIALNGVSLTINTIDDSGLVRIQLVPHTWDNTNFPALRVGDAINIETDILAKLLERQCLYAKP